jgi:xylan 1,4-beta-xylosidase
VPVRSNTLPAVCLDCDVDGAADVVPTTVTIDGIPVGVRRVLLQRYRVDDTHNNAYTTVWQAMGSSQHPTTKQYADLKAAGQLELLNLTGVAGRV